MGGDCIMGVSAGRVLLIPKGDWNAETTYTGLDWVRHNGAAWVCKNTCTNVEPTEENSDNWQMMARDGQSGSAINVDATMSDTSENPVQNKVIKKYVDDHSTDVADMTGATATQNGAHGLVPAPQMGDEKKALLGDGTWGSVDAILTFKTKEEYDAAVANDEIPDGAKVIKEYDEGDSTAIIDVDTSMSDTSENPVQNKVIKKYIDDETNTLKKSVSDGKTLVATAITDKGVNTAADATFAVMAENIGQIETGSGELHGATISVTTTESTLIGKTIKLSLNSTTVATKTFDSNGACSFTDIQEAGTYSLYSTDGTDSNTITVDITAENVINKTVISCEFYLTPDGEIVTPVNDVAILLKCAEIKGKNYTTIDELLADEQAMGDITMSENAMKYLARSTGFADAVCANETFMTLLGQSAYVDATVLNSDIWVSSISSSSYWDLIYPTVTVHSAASATITVAGKTFTSDASGNTTHSMPWGTFSISDSVSGQSFECTIDRDTTDVYVMPTNVLYWHGNNVGEFTDVSSNGSSSIATNSSNIILSYTGDGTGAIITGKKIDTTNISSITFYGTWTNCNYYGVVLLDHNVLTNRYINGEAAKHNFYNQSLTLDVSDMSGEYYIACGCENSPSKTSTFTCIQVSVN